MRIVADTNVLYQALRGQGGASHYILQLVKQSVVEKPSPYPFSWNIAMCCCA